MEIIQLIQFAKSIFQITRFEHAIMIVLAVFVGQSIALGSLPMLGLTIILSLFAPVFIEMASFALNDYLDVETDKINKKNDRPLVNGSMTTRQVMVVIISCYLIGLLLSFYVNEYAFTIVVVFGLFSVLYNWKLKDIALIGNLYIALSMAIPFIYGSLVLTGTVPMVVVIISLMAFLVGLGREIAKTVQDLEGDLKARNTKSLPVYIGVPKSLNITMFTYWMAVILSFYLVLNWFNGNLIPIILMMVADIMLIYIGYKVITNKNDKTLKMAQNYSLIALFIALISMIVMVIL